MYYVYKLTINILLITIKTILKTCSINKNVFTSKKVSARHSNKNNCHSNNNMEKQPDKKEIDNKNVFTQFHYLHSFIITASLLP